MYVYIVHTHSDIEVKSVEAVHGVRSVCVSVCACVWVSVSESGKGTGKNERTEKGY